MHGILLLQGWPPLGGYIMPVYKANGKKDGLQKYHIRINHTDKNGNPKQLTRVAYGLEAAKDMERRLLSEIKDQHENPSRKMTVQQLFGEHCKSKKHEVRETTLNKTELNYALYIEPMLANVRIDRLSVDLLQKWKQSIEAKKLIVNGNFQGNADCESIDILEGGIFIGDISSIELMIEKNAHFEGKSRKKNNNARIEYKQEDAPKEETKQ